MATSREIPAPTVVLPVGDGRVELTVVDDEIWLSDYGTGHNFTLVIPRTKLQGNKTACTNVFEHHNKKASAGKYTPSKRVAAASQLLAVEPPRMAGYWYELPNFGSHGGPVVVVEE